MGMCICNFLHLGSMTANRETKLRWFAPKEALCRRQPTSLLLDTSAVAIVVDSCYRPPFSPRRAPVVLVQIATGIGCSARKVQIGSHAHSPRGS